MLLSHWNLSRLAPEPVIDLDSAILVTCKMTQFSPVWMPQQGAFTAKSISCAMQHHATMKLAQQEFLFILPRSFGASDMFRLAETAKLVTTCS